MAVHLLFIVGLFGAGIDGGADILTSEVLAGFIELLPALLAYVISHGISFYLNYLRRQEYQGKDMARQMGEPYKRIVTMHVTIIFGGFLVMAFGTALPAMILLILLKLATDMRAHMAEHK
jgi:putative flippase GtrA